MSRGNMRNFTPSQQIENYVRGKTKIYRDWRRGRQYPTLDNMCAECLMRFGPMPMWEEYVQARRTRAYKTADDIERVFHREWKNLVRDWCLERGIVKYRNEASAFIKYYFAWYRYQQEQRHGPITDMVGRQMH